VNIDSTIGIGHKKTTKKTTKNGLKQEKTAKKHFFTYLTVSTFYLNCIILLLSELEIISLHCALCNGKVPCHVAVRRKFSVPDAKIQIVLETDGTEFDDFGFEELQAVAEAKHILMMLVSDEQWMAPVPVV